MTDNEIIKALECCTKARTLADCEKLECPALTKRGCFYYLKTDEYYEGIIFIELIKDALNLINRLQADNAELKNINESLKGSVDFLKATDVLSLKADLDNYKQIAENQQSVSMDKEVEIKRLKAEVERLEQRNITNCRNWQSKYNTLRADAVKEFADKAIDRVEKAKEKYQRLCKEQGEEMEEHMHIHFNGITGIIKNLLKEMEGAE